MIPFTFKVEVLHKKIIIFGALWYLKYSKSVIWRAIFTLKNSFPVEWFHWDAAWNYWVYCMWLEDTQADVLDLFLLVGNKYTVASLCHGCECNLVFSKQFQCSYSVWNLHVALTVPSRTIRAPWFTRAFLTNPLSLGQNARALAGH